MEQDLKEKEDQKINAVSTAKRYMKGNCEGGQSPSEIVELRKKNI